MKNYSKCITKPIAKLYIEEESQGLGDDILLYNLQNRIIRAFGRTSTEVQDFLQFIQICLDLNDIMIGMELGDYPPNVDLELGYHFYMHWLYNLCEKKIKEE